MSPDGGDTNPRYGMVVDLNRCVGCQTCTIACKHANDTPPGVQWRRVLDVERGTFPDVERLFMVVGCQHCAEPPCVPVCPTGSTKQRADGLVTMDYDTCIGCGYCAVSCPYQARTIGHDKDWYYGERTDQEAHVFHDERAGVANKCTFCVERIDEAKEEGKVPGVDLEYTPACSSACIASAIHFGDFNDPDSNVSILAKGNDFFQMHAELGTDPQIKYLYEVPNAMPGREPEPEDTEDETLSDSTNPLVGERQKFWDFRAAMNFTMGGMSTGLVIMATLAHFFSGLSTEALLYLNVVAGAGMAVGLFFVFLEIGRKARFMRVLLRPQSSWMTRETYAVAVFYPALLADLIWPSPGLHLLVALAALVFLYCQARILYAAKGVPAWRCDLIPTMLVMTGLLEGVGLLGMAGGFAPWRFEASMIFISASGAILTLLNALIWQRYYAFAKRNGLPPLARAELDRITPALRLLGHLAPLILFTLATEFSESLLAIAGIAAVAGGVMWKFTVITRACYLQGFALPKMPQRGSGTRAAPARTEGLDIKPLAAE
jgi:phenylacetyl-CoA:acceptor oxidoreductase subunit 1